MSERALSSHDSILFNAFPWNQVIWLGVGYVEHAGARRLCCYYMGTLAKCPVNRLQQCSWTILVSWLRVFHFCHNLHHSFLLAHFFTLSPHFFSMSNALLIPFFASTTQYHSRFLLTVLLALPLIDPRLFSAIIIPLHVSFPIHLIRCMLSVCRYCVWCPSIASHLVSTDWAHSALSSILPPPPQRVGVRLSVYASCSRPSLHGHNNKLHSVWCICAMHICYATYTH